MTPQFNQENQARIEKILSRYPNKMAACLPLLYVAQEQFDNYLSPEVMDLVAETLDLSSSHVYGVATFYTMFNKEKVGRYHVQVCTNVSCYLCGAHDVQGAVEKKLGIKAGQTTDDGLFTLTEVQCLAMCGTAPAVQINDDIHELVSVDGVGKLLDKLKAEAKKSK